MKPYRQAHIPVRRSECGQALAETAMFAMLAIFFIFGLLSWIPAHRARTAATSAAYACAQFLSQSPDPATAAYNAYTIAHDTVYGDWSATMGAQFSIEVYPASGPGQPGQCIVRYRPPTLFKMFNGSGDQVAISFVSRSESWKARWR